MVIFSKGVIAGISIGIIVFVVGISLLIYFLTIDDESFPGNTASQNPASGDDNTPIPNNIGYTNIVNRTGIAVTVYLDDIPPCFTANLNCSWENNDSPDSYVTRSDGTEDHVKLTSRIQNLGVGESWSIGMPITAEGRVNWCQDASSCIGTGGWVVRSGVNMPTAQRVTRFEFDWNADEFQKLTFWGNAVDGNNLNFKMFNTRREDKIVLVDLDLFPINEQHPFGCPFEAEATAGQPTCLAPKFEPGCDPDQLISVDNVVHTECEWADCNFTDNHTVCRCHKFWDTQANETTWRDYIDGDELGRSKSMESWRYDQFKTRSSASPDCCITASDTSECLTNNPDAIRPEVNLDPFNFGSLNILINGIK